ncbi:MAG: universal stress protein [Chloroflexi bacterium]|nr:MAG: universal stress protein [Chloroflexota bacterium]
MTNEGFYLTAIEDFNTARRQASIEELLSRITGRSNELLDYEEVRRQLRATTKVDRGIQDIPLDAIVGSVGRVKDFTRTFLPKNDNDAERWARVKSAANSLTGVPPIEVYQIGDVYFVIDGNHRVSIAQEQAWGSIQAYVTEVQTRVPISPDDDFEAVIAKSRYVEFLENTNLDKLRPNADFTMTFLGKYRVLLEHIDVHRYFMGIDQQRDISNEEAITHWYDTVYLPVVRMVHERGLLRDFPQRTEADLYLLLAEHREELKEALGWEVEADTAVSDLADQKSSRPSRVLSRFGGWLYDVITPDELESGPPPGQWRKERVTSRHSNSLFSELLVAVRGLGNDWRVLEQAIVLAQKENSNILGLHVVEKKQYERLQTVTRSSEEELVAQVQAEFDRKCVEAGINGRLAVEHGTVGRQVVKRAAYSDLVMVALNHPPGSQPLQRLASGLVTLIHRSPRPVLTIPPGPPSPMDRILLAYNASPKAKEALFIATYFAARHQVDLTIVAVNQYAEAAGWLKEAEAYLKEHGVTTIRSVEKTTDNPAGAILETVEAYQCNLIIMGGYEAQPLVQAILGSNVDKLLCESKVPILISR